MIEVCPWHAEVKRCERSTGLRRRAADTARFASRSPRPRDALPGARRDHRLGTHRPHRTALPARRPGDHRRAHAELSSLRVLVEQAADCPAAVRVGYREDRLDAATASSVASALSRCVGPKISDESTAARVGQFRDLRAAPDAPDRPPVGGDRADGAPATCVPSRVERIVFDGSRSDRRTGHSRTTWRIASPEASWSKPVFTSSRVRRPDSSRSTGSRPARYRSTKRGTSRRGTDEPR